MQRHQMKALIFEKSGQPGDVLALKKIEMPCDQSSFMTGSIVTADGGFTAK